MEEKWVVINKRADFAQIAKEFSIDPVLARIMRNRDVEGEEAIKMYLYGTEKDLCDGSSMKDMKKGISILQEKIQSQKKIRIIGDYDIDGICATYILKQGLTRCKAVADYRIPDRIKDGYGINEQLIRQAYEDGIDTIITCDNGIAAAEQIRLAKELGLTVLVTDHHEVPFEETEEGRRELLVPADAVINPKQKACRYPFKRLCGAAVAYKLIEQLYAQNNIAKEELSELMEFAAIATVGDVMELQGENRILVKEGLKRLKKTSHKGLAALIEANGLDRAGINAYQIGFVLGPCLNATGRLDTAKKALELLEAGDRETALKLSMELKELNETRKDMTAEGLARAIEQIENSSLKEDKVLTVYMPDCHESLAGIIAGRLRERYHKPVLVMTDAAEGLKGSGRSIESYSMYEELSKCKELFLKYGGHPMAAGFSLKKENYEALRLRLNQNTSLTEEDFIPKVRIDVPMPLEYITEPLIESMELLEPFGKGNEKPLFADKEISVLRMRRIGKNQNMLKFLLQKPGGLIMEAMCFMDADVCLDYYRSKFGQKEIEKAFAGRPNAIVMMLTYYPSINEYNGKRAMQIIIQNYK